MKVWGLSNTADCIMQINMMTEPIRMMYVQIAVGGAK